MTLRTWALGASLAVGAVLTATNARATPLDFSYVGNSFTASWEQDSNPVPESAGAGGFTIEAATNGIDPFGPFDQVYYSASGLGGGFWIPAMYGPTYADGGAQLILRPSSPQCSRQEATA